MIPPRLSSRALLLPIVLIVAALACNFNVSSFTEVTSEPPPRPTKVPQPAGEAAPVEEAVGDATPTPIPEFSTVTPAELAESLLEAEPPAFDPVGWGVRVGLLEPDTPRTRKSAPGWELGDQETFSVGIADPDSVPLYSVDPLTGEEATVTATEVEAELRLVTDLFYVWVDAAASEEVTDQALQAAAEQFASMGHALVQEVGGSEWTPGMDEDERLHLVYVPGLGTGVEARFRLLDEYPASVFAPSAEREVIFVNLDQVTPGEGSDVAAMTRAYWQMVAFNLDPNEPRWAVEGQARAVGDLAGFADARSIAAFLAASDTRLGAGPGASDEGAAQASAGANYLYHLYLHERVAAFQGQDPEAIVEPLPATDTAPIPGSEGLSAVAASPLKGLGAVDAAAADIGLDASANELFFDWTVANLIDDVNVDEGQYGYALAEAGNVCPVVTLSALPAINTYEIAPYAAHYYEMQSGTTVSVEFVGQQTSPLLADGPFAGEVALWSGQGEWMDVTLTRSVDLTGVERAALDFALWYDIQPNGDAAYVLASTDEGETWNALPGPRSTQMRGLPAYTGVSGGADVPAWLQERIDLTYFAGEEILLRFEYVTDGAVTGPGVMLDNVAIQDIGLADSFEALDTGWEVDGWLRTANVVPNEWGLFLVTEALGDAGEIVHAVTPLTVDAGGRASLSQALPSGVARSWLVVAFASQGAPFPAKYTLTIDGDFTLVTPPALPAGGLAAESFESSCGLFKRVSTPGYTDAIVDGAFSVQVNEPETTHVALAGGDYDDVVISVDTTQPLLPAIDGSWGAVCRYSDADNYYGFQLQSDGTHRIYAVVDGTASDLSPFESSEAILTGPSAENNVVVACIDQTLSLTVNGEVVASAEDSTFSSGQVGLLVATGLSTPVNVQFDDFVLTGPTGAGTPTEGVTPTPAPPEEICDCSYNRYNCRDFSTQQEAQACYNSCGGRANDVHLLDADFNGIVCETVFP